MRGYKTACAKYAQALEQVRQEEQKWYDQTAGPRIRYYASAEYQAARAENANSIVKLTPSRPWAPCPVRAHVR